MWRIAGVGAIGAAATCAGVIAYCSWGGGGGNSSAQVSCPIDRTHPPTIVTANLPRVSFEEARARVQFDIAVPQNLPTGIKPVSVLLSPDLGCPDQFQYIEITFEGPEYFFTITESDRGIGIGGHTESIEIDGVKGEMSVRDVPGYPRLKEVAWAKGGLSFIARPLLNDTLTQERFLEIIASIP